MQEYPDLELSLQTWRFRHNVYNDVCQKQQDAAKQQPLSGIAAPIAVARSITTHPQHSLSENIFRKQTITLQVFDAGGGSPYNNDGDAVDIWFNGVRISTNVQILAWPGISLPLTLQPSDLLTAKTNRLYFKVVNTGFWFDPGATIGVNIAPANASKIFQHASASNIRVHPQAIKWHLGLNQTTPVLNLALGLMCYDKRSWPESTLHVQRAQAGIPDSKGRIHKERIVTIDTKSAAAKARAIARSVKSVAGYPTIAGKDRDEFPPKAVIQNAGTAHIQYMTPTDNRASGAFLGKLLTPYNDGDQIELIDALIGSPLSGALFCRDAYTQ